MQSTYYSVVSCYRAQLTAHSSSILVPFRSSDSQYLQLDYVYVPGNT